MYSALNWWLTPSWLSFPFLFDMLVWRFSHHFLSSLSGHHPPEFAMTSLSSAVSTPAGAPRPQSILFR